MLARARAWRGMRTLGTCRRLSESCKISYYYSQAAVTITYWKTIQAHALLPAVDDASNLAPEIPRFAPLASRLFFSVHESCRAAPFLTAGFVFYPPPLRSSCHRRTTNTSGILQSSSKHL